MPGPYEPIINQEAEDAKLRTQQAELALAMKLVQQQQQYGAQMEQQRQAMNQQNLQQALAYNNAISPIEGDLQAQGFSASPIQQRAAIDRQYMQGRGQRMDQYSQRIGENFNRDIEMRRSNASGLTMAANQETDRARFLTLLKMAENEQMAQLEAAAEAAKAARGGRGGGGGGGGGSDVPTSGDAEALAEAETPLPDLRAEIQAGYAGSAKGQRAVSGLLGKSNEDLSDIGQRYAALKAHVRRVRAGKDKKPGTKDDKRVGYSLRRIKEEVVKPAAARQKERGKEKRKREKAGNKAAFRGY